MAQWVAFIVAELGRDADTFMPRNSYQNEQ
jgi:hypothetical protein